MKFCTKFSGDSDLAGPDAVKASLNASVFMYRGAAGELAET